jgi:hypothetical protein
MQIISRMQDVKPAAISGRRGDGGWGEYLKAKINKLETDSNIKTSRDLCNGISVFKKGSQPRNNTVQDEKGDLVTYSHSTLVR